MGVKNLISLGFPENLLYLCTAIEGNSHKTNNIKHITYENCYRTLE